MHKVIVEESDTHNVTVDTFSNTSNTQRENANTIFTSEKLYKSGDLAETLKDLTINNPEYYVSNSANGNKTKGDPASDPKKVTHTSDGKGKVTDTTNGISQQKLLSNRTLPVVISTMDPMIDYKIVMIGGDFRMLSMAVMKEVVADVVRVSAWVNRNPRHVSRT